MILVRKTVASPVGALHLVASDKGLVAVLWNQERPGRVRLTNSVADEAHTTLCSTEQQLSQYFRGERTRFTIPLDLRGTEFQKAVWTALLTIPFGETRSYRQIAAQLGNPGATQAVGGANGRNPVSILVPCHRVIGSSGALTGYAGGVQAKAHLLELEGFSAQTQLTLGLP